MAEPTTSTEGPSENEPKPKLVALDREREAPQPDPGPAAAPAGTGTGTARQGSRIGTWLLVALLAIAMVWGGFQTQQVEALGKRNTALSEQVQGLEVQLSATNLQIQTYEMQQELIREVTTDLAEQVGRLQALVDPLPAPAVQTEGP